MRVEITDLSNCKKQILIEVPADKVGEQFNRVSTMLAQSVNVPGFRRGRAPLSVIKTRFRKEIRDQVMRELLPNALHDAITENQLAMIGEPDIDELTLNDGQPLVFKAKVEVLPKFDLKQYRGLSVTKKLRIITEEMVAEQIEQMREQHATLVPIEDREARDQDFVTVDLRGKHLNHEAEDINAEGMTVQIASPELQPEFTENLRGMRVGDERTFTVRYQEDFHNPQMAGHEIEYTVKLQSIKIKELPELDDEFVAGLGEYENLADFRAKIRQRLEDAAIREADERLREELLNKLAQEHPIDVPETLVDGQTKERLQSFFRTLIQQGVNPTQTNLDWGSLRDTQREAAAGDVRRALIVEKIVEQEHIDVSEEEVEEEIARIAQSLNMPIDTTRSRLTKEGGIDSIKGRLRNKKALDLVINSAEIVEERVSAEELDRHDHGQEYVKDEQHEHHHHEGCEHGEHHE
ncbi:MAG: trigger factor [Acidobacteriota bacterium]